MTRGLIDGRDREPGKLGASRRDREYLLFDPDILVTECDDLMGR